MFIYLKGICKVVIRAFLHYLVLERQLFCLEDPNERIKHFNFNYFSIGKPALILKFIYQETKKMRQTAMQIFTLVHTLPILIAGMVDMNDEILVPHISCYTIIL